MLEVYWEVCRVIKTICVCVFTVALCVPLRRSDAKSLETADRRSK